MSDALTIPSLLKLPAFLTKPALLSKSVLVAAAASGGISFAIAEFFTEKTGIAIVLSMLSAPACAYFAAKPKIIAAEAAKAAAIAAQETSNRAQLSHDYSDHLRQVHLDYMRRIAVLEKQYADNEKIIALTRGSRHVIAGALTVTEAHLMLVAAGVTPPARKEPLDVAALLKEEDLQIAEIRGVPVVYPKETEG